MTAPAGRLVWVELMQLEHSAAQRVADALEAPGQRFLVQLVGGHSVQLHTPRLKWRHTGLETTSLCIIGEELPPNGDLE